MSQLYLGSIDLSKIDKTKINEVTKKDGTVDKYLNVSIWIDENAQEEWKQCSIQQSSKKEDPTIYLGNAKKWLKNGDISQERANNESTASNGHDDLPF